MNPSKPRILLIPNVSFWILGDMAREIFKLFSPGYDFFFLSEPIIHRRAGLFRELLERVDLVHALNESAVELLLRSGAKPLPPLMTWIHHVTSWSRDHQLAVEHSRIINACTPGWAGVIRERAGRDLDLRVVRHGVDLEMFRSRSPGRARLGIPPEAFAVGFAAGKGSDKDGRRKGVDVLMACLRELAVRIPNLHVTFTAEGWEEEIRALGKEGISANCTGYLRKSRLPLFYSSLDAYVMTSRVEGGPVTVLEAMACSCPVVATKVGLVEESITHGVDGFVAEVGDAPALAAALARLAAHPEKAREVGRAARARVEAMPWSATLEALRGPYENLAGEGGVSQAGSGEGLPVPVKLMGAVSAADAMLITYNRLRQGESAWTRHIKVLAEMLSGLRARDLARGLGLLARREWL